MTQVVITLNDQGQAQVVSDLDPANVALLLHKLLLHGVQTTPVQTQPAGSVVHATAVPPVNRVSGNGR